MAKRAFKFGLLFTLLSLFGHSSIAEEVSFTTLPKFNIFTEDWVPFQFYTEEAELDGMAIELLELILKETGSEQSRDDINMVPWARAVRSLSIKNTIVFSMLVTGERLHKYQWVGPIYKIRNYVYVRADSDLSKESFSDGNTLTTSVIIGDVNFQYMSNLNVSDDRIAKVSVPESPVNMLNRGHVDFVIDNSLNFKEMVERVGLKEKDFKQIFIVDSAHISYAISLNTSDNYVQEMQTALNSIKASSAYGALLKKYDL